MKKVCFATIAAAASLMLAVPAFADDHRVTICHVPPGNPGNARTIEVAPQAVDAHLANGSHLGACVEVEVEVPEVPEVELPKVPEVDVPVQLPKVDVPEVELPEVVPFTPQPLDPPASVEVPEAPHQVCDVGGGWTMKMGTHAPYPDFATPARQPATADDASIEVLGSAAAISRPAAAVGGELPRTGGALTLLWIGLGLLGSGQALRRLV